MASRDVYFIYVDVLNEENGGPMLIEADRSAGVYRIAINNASTSAELASDFSYLTAAPGAS
jgi:hypothetical protein